MSAPVVIGSATLYNADALAVLPQLSGLDALLTDPPYSSGGQFRSDRMQDTRTKYVQTGSSSRALPDFSGDNRDQRARILDRALVDGRVAGVQARRGSCSLRTGGNFPRQPITCRPEDGYGLASCRGASRMHGRNLAASRRNVNM